ncbi:E3 ubiquitin-protein ligase AIP2 [Impatiens glandulifera]|uniref:E3 ubiquitin-protein ligase AIP2 n=1 Tax=Impatiens glandulifera TaxID=253017 RepID=UPI001FB0B93F|nr:E3 ubiquitin-protein ligase AIP2 [Impatiens glandulifera]
MASKSEEDLKQKLTDLQKQLGKKQSFETAVSSIKTLLLESYPSASPSLRKLFFAVISRVSTILKTRYTAPGFWIAGRDLFIDAECLMSAPVEKDHLRSYISQAKQHLHELENQLEGPELAAATSNRGYLFEGHLTVDPEPPQPDWLIQTNLMTALAASLTRPVSSEGQQEDPSTSDVTNNLMQQLVESLDNTIPMIFEDGTGGPRAVPPASKEVVANLPVLDITEENITKIDKDSECAICKENFVVGDKMQELPCKHKFHPQCLKPWLDETNSCPTCRHELRTDDHAYETRKEREKEDEEERKGAANAVRGGEYMYV